MESNDAIKNSGSTLSASDKKRVMDAAYEAGTILLENGAEISSVEETMSRMASHFGTEDDSFFVLSNGIMATEKHYARSKYIPILGTCLEKVVEVNQLSRDVVQGKCDLDEVERRLKQIRNMKAKPAIEQIMGSAAGSAAFCIIFGGGIFDSIAAFISGTLLWTFMYFVGFRYMSRIMGNFIGGLFAAGLCIIMYAMGLGTHLSNMIIGAIIPLIPGVPFTNGIRDLANEDYIAGVTRLLDALLAFFCISLGVAAAFMIDAAIIGQIQPLQELTADPDTSGMTVQLISAFVGTLAFSILFGVPRRHYIYCGIAGMLGWLLYLLLMWDTEISPTIIVFLSTALVTFVSIMMSILRKCPVAVFLICGIFPLVPGAGVFWTTYNIVANHIPAAMSSGFMAVKNTVAIAFGILIINELRGQKIAKRMLRRRIKK
ncbi:MAG: threonine/serine exporter family protein [Bacteroidales bacterium]|nr:threonine/serine exporter family protein [Bacteroidales bacterium]